MQSRYARTLPILIAAALTLSVGSGCQRIEEAVLPSPKVVTREATVAAPAAKVNGELPAEMPQQLPIWPGATVVSADASAGTIALTLETTSTFKDVVAGTSVGFERAGWSVAEEASEASATVLSFSGEGYDGFVTVTDADAGVTLDYVIAEAAE